MITSSCYQLLLVFKGKIRARNRKVSAALINWAVKPFCVFKFGGRWKCAFQEMHTKNSYPKGFENDTRTKPLWVTSSLCFHGVIIFTLCSSTTSWQNPWKTSLLWYRFIFSTFRELKDWVRKSCLQWNPFPEGKGTSLVSLELPAAVTDCWWATAKSRLSTSFSNCDAMAIWRQPPCNSVFKSSWNPPLYARTCWWFNEGG